LKIIKNGDGTGVFSSIQSGCPDHSMDIRNARQDAEKKGKKEIQLFSYPLIHGGSGRHALIL
jgi:hypothetical protein